MLVCLQAMGKISSLLGSMCLREKRSATLRLAEEKLSKSLAAIETHRAKVRACLSP